MTCVAVACLPQKHDDLPDWQQFDKYLTYKKLKWGVVQELQMDNGIGHVTFSADTVKPLVKGKLYN
ncbi:hypothetical protein N7455_011171 [Penicillium solitum]|uniref:uncharacterized protein n=1 Tax=Penicillium solitum TaxID=60172 RepID=UPI0018280C6A|nr:hypothetical protein HAV15_009957 [Penicillium sp. str. \